MVIVSPEDLGLPNGLNNGGDQEGGAAFLRLQALYICPEMTRVLRGYWAQPALSIETSLLQDLPFHTMAEILHLLRLAVNPIIYRVSYIPGASQKREKQPRRTGGCEISRTDKIYETKKDRSSKRFEKQCLSLSHAHRRENGRTAYGPAAPTPLRGSSGRRGEARFWWVHLCAFAPSCERSKGGYSGSSASAAPLAGPKPAKVRNRMPNRMPCVMEYGRDSELSVLLKVVLQKRRSCPMLV